MKKFLRKHFILLIAVLYFVSPFDFLPDIFPAFGFSDDIVVMLIALATKYVEYLKQKENNIPDKVKENIVDGEIIDEG
ncbi:YkvA family protein [Patescibacteria group bacterium]